MFVGAYMRGGVGRQSNLVMIGDPHPYHGQVRITTTHLGIIEGQVAFGEEGNTGRRLSLDAMGMLYLYNERYMYETRVTISRLGADVKHLMEEKHPPYKRVVSQMGALTSSRPFLRRALVYTAHISRSEISYRETMVPQCSSRSLSGWDCWMTS